MAHLVGDLISYFQFDDINIDNWHFKMYYKGGTILFFVGSMVGVFSQYFGDPIECDFTTIGADLASDYCWIHGSSYIPIEYQQHMRCIADLEGVASEDDAPDTSYYQWVVFMMLLQAGLFYVPYKIWVYMEGGLISSFGKDAKSAVIVTRDNHVDGDDGVVMETMVNKFVKYYKSIFHHNQWYFAKFVFCEFLNVFVLYLNFWLTDKFLQGKFWYYGVDVIRFYQLTKAERKMEVSPFCNVFPTEVSCTVPNIGAAGIAQDHNGMCVLSQNIINEKIYLIIWWYLVAAIMISIVFVFYRVATLMFEPLRFGLMYSLISHKYDEEVKRSLRVVMNKGYLGDWFVLIQLGKNMNMYFMREFVKEMRAELVIKPKRSKSVNRDKADTLSRGEKASLAESAKLAPASPKAKAPVGDQGAKSLLCCCGEGDDGGSVRQRSKTKKKGGKKRSSSSRSGSRAASKERRPLVEAGSANNAEVQPPQDVRL